MSPEEQKKHKNFFSKLSLAFFSYILITQLLAVVVTLFFEASYPELLKNGNFSLLLSCVIQYVIAFPLLALSLKKLPARTPEVRELDGKRLFKYLTIVVFVMQIGSYISSIILAALETNLGSVPQNSVETLLSESNILLSVLLVGIIGPIVEEIIFRKLFIDRLIPYGEAIAVFLPSAIFGLIHGNLYQLFYAFLIGAALSYIYVKTGKIIYTAAIHIFINLFCGVFPSYILSMLDIDELMEIAYSGNITEEYILANLTPLTLFGIYSFVSTALLIIGVFNFNRNLYKLRFNKGEIRLPKGSGADIVLFNKGTVLLISICVVIIAISTFSFAFT